MLGRLIKTVVKSFWTENFHGLRNVIWEITIKNKSKEGLSLMTDESMSKWKDLHKVFRKWMIEVLRCQIYDIPTINVYAS